MFGTEAFASVMADLDHSCDFVLLDGLHPLASRTRVIDASCGWTDRGRKPRDLGTGLFEQTFIWSMNIVFGLPNNENEARHHPFPDLSESSMNPPYRGYPKLPT